VSGPQAPAPRRRAVGVVAAASAALIGAWLGSHATAGLLAVLTTIAAAAAAANLALIGLDASSIGGVRGTDEAPPPAPAEPVAEAPRTVVPHG
jgi:hypothetical protein